MKYKVTAYQSEGTDYHVAEECTVEANSEYEALTKQNRVLLYEYYEVAKADAED